MVLYVCMYVCMCVCVYRSCVCVCVCVCMYVCMYVQEEDPQDRGSGRKPCEALEARGRPDAHRGHGSLVQEEAN